MLYVADCTNNCPGCQEYIVHIAMFSGYSWKLKGISENSLYYSRKSEYLWPSDKQCWTYLVFAYYLSIRCSFIRGILWGSYQNSQVSILLNNVLTSTRGNWSFSFDFLEQLFPVCVILNIQLLVIVLALWELQTNRFGFHKMVNVCFYPWFSH